MFGFKSNVTTLRLIFGMRNIDSTIRYNDIILDSKLLRKIDVTSNGDIRAAIECSRYIFRDMKLYCSIL